MEVCHLVTGTCVVRTGNGIHIDTLGEGSAIGHLDAVLGTTCGADVIAKTYCTMYCLPVLDLWEVLQACYHLPQNSTGMAAWAVLTTRSCSKAETVSFSVHQACCGRMELIVRVEQVHNLSIVQVGAGLP